MESLKYLLADFSVAELLIYFFVTVFVTITVHGINVIKLITYTILWRWQPNWSIMTTFIDVFVVHSRLLMVFPFLVDGLCICSSVYLVSW